MSTRKQETSDRCAEYFKALADANRLRIATRLMKSELSVTEIANELELSIVKVSRDLGILHRFGIVEKRRDGRSILYRVNPEFAKQSKAPSCGLDFGCCELTFD